MSNNRYRKLGNESQRAAIRAEVYKMHLKGQSLTAIGKELGFSHETARKLIKEYIDQLTVPLAEQMRKAENDKLDRVEAVAWKLLEDQHVAFQHGKVVTHDGKPLEDAEPVFKALDRIVKTSESRRRLWGLDVPVKTEHVVTTSSVVDESIKSLMEEMEARNAEELRKLGG